MRNLLALAALGVIVFLGLGWYLGWYKVQSTPTADGHRHIEIDLNTNKVKSDIKNDVNKVETKVNNWVNDTTGSMPQSSTNNPTTNGTTTSFSPIQDGSFIFPGSSSPPSGGPALPQPR